MIRASRTPRRAAWWSRIALAGLAPSLVLGVLELASRVVHRGHVPLLPYYFEDGAAFLYAGSDLSASFYGSPANRYIIDAHGARVAAPGLPEDWLDRGVFVLGDSQALGYMLEFEETFASRVAATLLGDARRARVLAAPTNHPDTYGPVLGRFAPRSRSRARLAVLTLNLGNDLDEMYTAGLDWSRERTSGSRRWFLCHSFVYMDLELIRAHRLNAGQETAGINQILYMLESDERVMLGRAAAEKVGRLLDAIPADEKAVVIVPTDIQVDPDEFRKYRRYYKDVAQFAELDRRRGEFSAMMNVLEGYIAGRLEREGRRVIRLSRLPGIRQPGTPLFMDSNHHITARAHAMIAEALGASLGQGNRPKLTSIGPREAR